MPLRAIAYVSRARPELQPAELDALLADATAFNRMAGVTGVLMFDGERFLQYLEGPADGLESVFARVLNARRHEGVQQLASGPLPARWFPRWTMANRRIEASLLSDIIDAPWQGFEGPSTASRRGFALLLRNWLGGHGELEPAAVSLGS
ncbi:BLUF domain-containing protein [Stenotrophomonas tumulicola]|uniref:BLUF domain-containing protein n=1 Tax=Stenotrophomonas tumulicola TaxID=1685415 RepID=A0A7W3FJA5_9GAMM|nr:BLUF domain-containing protein [Stenotrophomonas tumulicola]MBA8680530.1 BLUF domain-containing protein [Stenotrophomonas tumulicola]